MRLITFAFLALGLASAQSSEDVSKAIEEGRAMTLPESAEMEEKVRQRPKSALDRIRLLTFYSESQQVDPAVAIEGRRRHLLWLAQEAPELELWRQHSQRTAVYRSAGHLPDPEGFEQIRDVWLQHLQAKKASKEIRENAANFLRFDDRETATRLVRESGNSRYLGTHFASVLLGVTARDFTRGAPVAADPSVRESQLGKEILAELERASDPELLGSAALSLSRDGATLWSLGLTDWDYSSFIKDLLTRAQQLDPTELSWHFVNPEIPKPGEKRGLGFIRIGGALMKERLIHQVLPKVPAHLAGINGKVSLAVAVGVDGKVIKVIPVGGPPELYDLSIQAIEQWVYRKTLLNKEPMIVLTAIDVTYH